jgi:hypothetical protein
MKLNELTVTRTQKIACFGGGFNTEKIHEMTEWKGMPLGLKIGIETELADELLMLANPCILDSDETHVQVELWEGEYAWLPKDEIKCIEYLFCNVSKIWMLHGLVITASLRNRIK